jgi:hypothetical protein
MGNWGNFANSVNNAYFFVADKILDLQRFFIYQAKGIGRIVFLIALLSAGLNYAITGTGLKENLIKIFKATVFFMIVISFYPRIIGWITSYTFSLAEDSVYPSIREYFYQTAEKTLDYVDYDSKGRTYVNKTITQVVSTSDKNLIFYDKGNLSTKRENKVMNYQTVTPATVLQVLFLVASECFNYAEYSEGFSLSNLGTLIANVFKGLLCGFIIIFTGVFALLEYLICFLEFMLVASVGVILFPMSIWEGSKFLTEGFIKAILGFFLKLLFCNIAIFLLVYGFVSLLKIISQTGFIGTIDQLVFIVFICALFFYICKSAPGIAQSLLSGSPSLSASGAFSAAKGAVSAAGAVMGFAGKVGGKAAGAATGGIIGGVGSIKEANAARHSAMSDVADAGGSVKQQKSAGRFAFADSLASDAGDAIKAGALGLTRSLLSGGQKGSGGSAGGINPHSWLQDFKNTPGADGHQSLGEHMDKRRVEGRRRGQSSADDYIKSSQQLSANRERQNDPDYKSSLDELNKDFPGPSKNDIK